MNNKYWQSIQEYFNSFCIALLLSMILPNIWLIPIQNSFLYLFSNIPITIPFVLLMNLGTMLLIIILGILRIKSISFFLMLNGFALGILFMLYKENILLFFNLLFPHALFEMVLIIIFCSLVKEISEAYTLQKSTKIISKLWIKLLYLCIPLWIISAILENIYI